MASVASIVERKCVVCGQGSHRADWASKDYPACDNHTEDEVKAAIAALQPPSPPAVAPQPATPAPSQPAASTVAPKAPTV